MRGYFFYLQQNKRETVKSIAEHIEVPYTDQLLDEIVSATEFDTMKKAKHSSEEAIRKISGPKASFYRKGITLFKKSVMFSRIIKRKLYVLFVKVGDRLEENCTY